MARRKEPAIVWEDGGLIHIKPINSETVYFTDYSEEVYRTISGVRWRVVLNGYLQGFVNGKLTLLHHLILGRKDGFLVDHINRRKEDNTSANLRYVNRSESGINRNKQKSNTSGLVGVYYYKSRQKWKAQMRVNGFNKHLGYFNTKEKASEAYQNALDTYYPGIFVCS